jgi:WD40 repeat protein
MDGNPVNPFKGLRPYSQEDRDKLFGRDRDLILMKDRIFSARTTLLFAGSGVGKTSFLNAKVIPELKKQCVVVWHNRWTGADESPDYVEIQDEPMRFWPPRVLLRELVRKYRSFREGDVSVAPVTHDPLANTDDAFEAEMRKLISQNLRCSSGAQLPGLSEAFSRFRKSVNQDGPNTNRCVLILDQFEEVFQYHAYEDYFRAFVTDICKIINNDDYQVRVVFSMREEFLGELSVFDNRIPDLFSNYYRLRYPDKEEAKEIIRRTCQLSGVDLDEDKLPSLVEDLSKIAKGAGSFAERSTTPGRAGVYVIKRDFVAPPYLQIACERLWNKQYTSIGNKNRPQAQTNPNNAAENAPPRFLVDYRAGSDAGKDSGGDAQSAVIGFCEEKLSRPFLSRNEQDIVARAFSFLVTKQGAKMAYELSSLADHMQEHVRPLKTALEKLSQDEAKILRESRGPDRSYWFELYHDMYATIVDDWKVRYFAQRRRRYLLKASLTVLILLFTIVVYYWIVSPQKNRRQLESFRDQICGLGEQAGYAGAVSAFASLKNTFGYGATANSLWAQILEQRSQCFAKNNDPSSALLTLLKAATMASGSAERIRLAKAANILMGAPNGSLLATYCDDCGSATLSPDGKTVLSVNVDGHVRLWNADTGEPLGQPLCPDCRQSRPAARKALFSSNGKQVLTVAGVRRCDEGSDPDMTTETGLKIQIWDTANRTALLPKPLCLIDLAESEVRTTTGPAFGKQNPQDRGEGGPPSIDIRTFAKVGENFWIAGVRGKEIHVWDSQGAERTIGAGRDPGSVGVAFSPGGLYLAGFFSNESIKLWRVTESQIEPDPLKNSLAIAFGPQHQLLTAEPGNVVKIIDLDSGKTLVTVNAVAGLPAGSELQNIGFSPSGEQFITRVRTADGDFVRAWLAANGEPMFNSLDLFNRVRRSGLSADGKTVLVDADGDPPVIEKWDLQGGRLTGAIKRKFDSATFRPDRNSVMVFSGTTARLWEFDADAQVSRVLRARDINPYELTADGKILITVNGAGYLQFWNAESATVISEPKSLPSEVRLATISADGSYAATDTNDDKVRIWQPGRNEPLAEFIAPGESTTMAFSRDGQVLARAGSNDLKVWNLSSKKEVNLHGHTGTINDVALTSRVVITGSSDKAARIWNVQTGQTLHTLANDDTVQAVAISPDGRSAISGCSDGTIRLWDVESGSRLGEIRVKDPIRRIKFSTDGGRFAVLTPSWIYLVRVDSGTLTYEGGALIADPWQPVFNLSPDGKQLRFAYLLGANAVQLHDLDLDPIDLGNLADNPAQALDQWQKRLGLRVGELGQIRKLWGDEQLADATPQH